MFGLVIRIRHGKGVSVWASPVSGNCGSPVVLSRVTVLGPAPSWSRCRCCPRTPVVDAGVVRIRVPRPKRPNGRQPAVFTTCCMLAAGRTAPDRLCR